MICVTFHIFAQYAVSYIRNTCSKQECIQLHCKSHVTLNRAIVKLPAICTTSKEIGVFTMHALSAKYCKTLGG